MKTISERKKARKMKAAMMKAVPVLVCLIIFVYVYAIASAFLATN